MTSKISPIFLFSWPISTTTDYTYIFFISLALLILCALYLFIYLRFFWLRKKTKEAQTLIIQLESELTEQNRKIQELLDESARKHIFTTNILAEMRTPLNAIYGFAELLTEDPSSVKDQKKYIQMIGGNAQNLLNTLNDASDFTRIEKDQLAISIERKSINEIIDETEKYAKREARKNNLQHLSINTVKYFDSGTSCFFTDGNRLSQVLTNLISNALRMTKTGFIEFGYKALDNNQLLFFVSDSGTGFSKEEQASIFDEFLNTVDAKSAKSFGFGLNILLSKMIVEKMGGKIWIESVKNSGSTFYFSLPCEPCLPNQKQESLSPATISTGCWTDRTILVVDDYKDIYYYFAEVLSDTGIKFYYAENGFQAISLCEQHPEIELVLMDIQMPEMSGFEATRQIRKIRHELPIIAQTAHSVDTDYDSFIDAGFNDLINKPIDKKLLTEKIGKFLNR